MGKVKDKTKPEERMFPGMALEVFKGAVETVVGLRDTGKYLIFLGRQSSMRIIGEEKDFVNLVVEQDACKHLGEEGAMNSLEEVRHYAAACGTIGSEEGIVRFVTGAVYDDEYDALDDKGKEAFRQEVGEKVRCVKQALYTDALQERGVRQGTATVPCLEDIDVELVSQRKSGLPGREFGEPFLRVRLRHSETGGGVSQFMSRYAVWWGEAGADGLESFEFECDESDIDLLLLRLREAKDILLSARNGKDEK